MKEIDEALQLALQHHRHGQVNQAREIYRQILAREPRNPEALHLLGVLAGQCGNLPAAIELIGKAISFKPGVAEFHSNLANALRESGQIDQAMAACRHALQLNGNLIDAHNNLGAMLEQQRRFGEAIAAYEQAIRIDPQFARAHVNKALLLLRLGDFERGWREYEWRFQSPDFQSFHPDADHPLWDGKELNGRTLLMHGDQGLGDTIQFIRYASLLATGNGRVIVSCQAALFRLLQCLNGPSLQIAERGNLPHADVHCSMMSLPYLLGTRVETVPAPGPRLAAPTDVVQAWSKKMIPLIGRLKVGLVWAGSSNEKRRAILPRDFAPFWKVPGITLFSLQKGAAAVQAADLGPDLPLIDLTADLHDFADTAALIAHLDLVISIDTSTPHVAGAMGKPVWVLVPFNADWRWLMDREDSPWYPTLRLFRQKTPGDWAEVIARVAKALGKWHGHPARVADRQG